MNIFNRDTGHQSYVNNAVSNTYSLEGLAPKELYSKLKEYYENSENIYSPAQKYAYYTNTWIEAIKPVKTVVNRSVEFYVSKIVPGDISQLRITSNNQLVKDCIAQVWKWSNFGAQKQIAIRYLALYGDLFIKVSNEQGKVFFEIIPPYNVSNFTEDSRGYITSIRIDVPQGNKTYTEYWNKDDGYYSIWLKENGETQELDQLGQPSDSGYIEEFGIKFIPIVHIKFRDTGEKRGKSCVYHSLSKIDEANRQATRLYQMLFRYNKALWVISANTMDSIGRPMPAPQIKDSDTELDMNDNNMLFMPGMSTLQTLVPPINYADALNILKDTIEEIEKDLPELRYYSLQYNASMSGKAIKLLLSAAIDRAVEAQGNFLTGLTRLDEMALTIGKYFGLFPQTIGSFDNNDFSHSIMPMEMFPIDESDRATLLTAYVGAGMSLESALKLVGFSEQQVVEIVESPIVS